MIAIGIAIILIIMATIFIISHFIEKKQEELYNYYYMENNIREHL